MIPWKGSEISAAYMIPFYSNVTSANVPPPDAVRSDGWKYMDDQHALDRFYFDQTLRLGNNTFGRFSTGYFDMQYAGAGGGGPDPFPETAALLSGSSRTGLGSVTRQPHGT